MRHLIAPPVFENDEDKTRIARLLNAILLTAVAATVMLIIATPLASSDLGAPWLLESVLVLLELSALVLMRRGHVQLASALFTSGAWAYVTLVVFTFGGVRSPNMVSYVTVVLIAGFLGGKPARIGFAGLSALAGLGMLYAEMSGALPPPVVPLTPAGWWVALTANLIMVTALQHFATRSISEALELARREIADRKHAEAALRQAEEALQHRLAQLAALHATLLAITAQQELPTLLATIVECATRLLDSSGGGLYLCDPERREARCVVSYKTLRDYVGVTLKYGEGAAGHVAATGKPLIIDDYRAWRGRAAVYEADQPFRAVISAPLIWQGQVTGVIHVHNAEMRHFQPEDLDLLTLFANQAAIVVENTRLFEAERRARQTAETLRAANLALTRTLDLDAVLETLLDYLSWIVPYDSANVMLLEADSRLVVRAARGYERWTDLQRVRAITFNVHANPHLNALLSTQQSILIRDTTAHPGWEHHASTEYVRNWLGVPLVAGGEAIGLYSLDKAEPGFFTEEHLRLAEALAAQAAVAIQNARLHDQAQRHAAELEQRVAERTRELAGANEQLREIDRLKSKFVSDVSHELRTPVANLSLYVSLLERGRPEKRDDYLTVLKEQTGRLKSLIEGILSLSELDLEKDKVNFTRLDLNAVVEPILAHHRPRAEAASLQLTFDAGAGMLTVNGHIDLLAQVITHLVVNALNFTSAGQVQVRTYRTANEVCLEVQDTGRGISPEDMPHLFERFYRGKGVAQSPIPGNGLGLAIVKELVEAHRGRIEVESEVGVGSRFRVWLPLS